MKKIKKDLEYNGRDKAYVDIDRIINEGLAGGTVINRDQPNIEETRELPEEEPPSSID